MPLLRDAQYRPTNGPYKDLQSGGHLSVNIVHGGINLLTYHDNPNVTFHCTATTYTRDGISLQSNQIINRQLMFGCHLEGIKRKEGCGLSNFAASDYIYGTYYLTATSGNIPK